MWVSSSPLCISNPRYDNVISVLQQGPCAFSFFSPWPDLGIFLYLSGDIRYPLFCHLLTVSIMSERRFSLAIEDYDSSESPESPTNKPLSGFLVDNLRPALTKSMSFTSPSKVQELTPHRRFSICDLNTFGEDNSQRSPEQCSPRSCNFKNHHRRNSVAIKFLLPRTADSSMTSDDG